MDFGISTFVFRHRKLTIEMLESLREAGYRRIELFCIRPHLDFHDRGLQRAIGRWFQENRMDAPSLHLPFVEDPGTPDALWISPLDPERRSRESALDKIKRSLEVADHVRPEFVVMHLGNPGQSFNPALFEYAYSAISQIRAFCGAQILVENIPNEISTLDRLLEFKAVAQLEEIGVCYDTGHANLQAGVRTIGVWKDIRAVHLSDNRNGTDEHLWPFEGSLNWPALVAELVEANYDKALTFETAGNGLPAGAGAGERLSALWDEARSSPEEFGLKYRLPGAVEEG